MGVPFTFRGLDHVQLAGPAGCEAAQREFFVEILGWEEIPKPESLRSRGGVWFQCGVHQVHIGIQKDFAPATKAHPAFAVENLDALRHHLSRHGFQVMEDFAGTHEGLTRFYLDDPFGNRLEFVERDSV